MKKLIYILIVILIVVNVEAQEEVSTNTLTTQFNGSGGLSLDADGNLYIADFGDFLSAPDSDGLPNNVWKLDRDLNLTVYAPGFQGASGNAFDSNGVLYQSDIDDSAIYKIENGQRVFVTNAGISGPVGIVFDSNDNFYVCNCGNNTIRKVTPSGQSTLFASGSTAFFNCPNGITIDDNNNLYVVSFSNSNIVKITPSGTKSIIGSTNAGNGHLDYDPVTNNLYIASFSGHQIFSLSLNESTTGVELLAGNGALGNIDGDALNSSFMYPNGVAVSKTGDSIYINSSTNTNISTLNPQIVRLIKGVLSSELSVESFNGFSNFKAYPNPVEDTFFIDSELMFTTQNLSLKVFDLKGSLMKHVPKLEVIDKRLNISVDLSKLSTGTYFYTIYNNAMSLKAGKLIKK